MGKYERNELHSNTYVELITILDSEQASRGILESLVFDVQKTNARYVLVDYLLRAGLNEYRFVAYLLDNEGRILLNSYQYVGVPRSLRMFANRVMLRHKDAMSISLLSRNQMERIESEM